MYTARDVLLQDYFDLAEGETRAGQLCPSCQGGSTREGTLSVSRRDGAVVWFCHRDSCNFKGTERGYSAGRTKTATLVSTSTTRGVAGRAILSEAEGLSEEARSYLNARYSLDQSHLAKWRLGWDTESNRLCLPVLTRTGDTAGVVLRSLSGQSPKTITHTDDDAIAWYTNPRQGGIIVVEDQLSAMRAADYMTAVALLGTHLNENRVAELRASKRSPIYLALDNDAIGTAIRHLIKYRSFLKVQLVRLTKDIKDHTTEELDELMRGINGATTSRGSDPVEN